MGINLTKGSKIDLTKGNSGLNEILVGLGWDPQQKRGLFGLGGSSDFDLDASAYVMGDNGRIDRVYYGHRTGSGVYHTGDNLTGHGDGDDEQLIITLSNVPANATKIGFTVDIYQAASRCQNFGMVKNAYIRLVDKATGQEICRYNLGDDFKKETAVIMGEVYRHNGEWKFSAIGAGFNDGRRALEDYYR